MSRRKGTKTTIQGKNVRPWADLVERDFHADGPDQLWVADITYIPTWAGFLYLAIVLDVWSRRIVGWSMATHLRTELVLDALDMAVHQRRPDQVVHHPDQGTQARFKLWSRSGRAARSSGSNPRWDPWVTATTTSSRASPTPDEGTPQSRRCRPSTSSGFIA